MDPHARTAIEHALDEFTRGVRPTSLREAVRYALLGAGKRLRPLLCWHASIAAGGRGEQALPAALAVELVHTFSLVHDDLPAMDDDDLRRGRPTLHIHAGEAMAILAGDALLTLAFAALAERAAHPSLAAALARELVSGTMGMIAGQVHDTLGGLPPGLADRERVEAIHRDKTGALIRAACRMGGRCAGADDRTLAALTAYGEAVGLMFQIVDDLLDVEGTSEQTGKRTQKDRAAGKLTFPDVLGIDASRREVERLRGAADAAIADLGPPAAGLRALIASIADRQR